MKSLKGNCLILPIVSVLVLLDFMLIFYTFTYVPWLYMKDRKFLQMHLVWDSNTVFLASWLFNIVLHNFSRAKDLDFWISLFGSVLLLACPIQSTVSAPLWLKCQATKQNVSTN